MSVLQRVRKLYPGAIRKGDGKGFVRPNGFGSYTANQTRGWYWTNLDGDRFYHRTASAAAADFATEIDLQPGEGVS